MLIEQPIFMIKINFDAAEDLFITAGVNPHWMFNVSFHWFFDCINLKTFLTETLVPLDESTT